MRGKRFRLSFFRFFFNIPIYVALCNALVFAQSSPDPNVAAEFSQGIAAMRAGKLDEARAKFALVVKQQPQFAEAHFNLGLANEEQGDYEAATASFQKA